MKIRFRTLIATLAALTLAAAPVISETPQYDIGICQLIQHAALDSAAQGFKDAVTAQLGDQVSFTEQNASGDSATCISIVNSFIAEEVDLILANSTQALQAAYAATGEIPILGTAVTDYPAALDMDEWNGTTGVNVSGASDLAPLDGQAELIRDLFPEAKNIGLLYCSAEVNSEYQIGLISEYLTEMGYSCTEYAFTDTNDVFSITQNACMDSDVIFVPTDNTIASCTELIRNVIEIEGKPIIGGDEGICKGCGVATICIDYYDLGKVTGEMACKILADGADITSMPIAFSPTFSTVYNAEMCELLGVTIPDGYEVID